MFKFSRALPALAAAAIIALAGCGGAAQQGTPEEDIMYITVNGNRLTVDTEDNASSRALLERLRPGDVEVEMSDYGDMEKVGCLGFDLPRSDSRISVAPGDVILYLGNQITVYYDVNSRNFTRIGHVRGVNSREDMLQLLGGAGDITAVFSV